MIDLIKISRRQLGRLARLATGKKHTVQVKTQYSAHMLEVEDVNFHLDSAVFMPDYGPDALSGGNADQDKIMGLAVLKVCYEHAAVNPSQSALVVGHTDRSGDAGYNQTLSELRATGFLHALKGGKAEWAAVCHGRHRAEDYQQILAWIDRRFGWGCDPGGVDNQPGPQTQAALIAFKKRFNAEKGGTLPASGSMDLATWQAFFTMYEADLQVMMGANAAGLATAREALKFLPCGAIGCGEGFPITDDRAEHYQSPVDRRVEVLFFDPGEQPALDCKKPGGACSELYSKKMYVFKRIAGVPPRPLTYKAKLTFLGPTHVPQGPKYGCLFSLTDEANAEIATGAELTGAAYRVFIRDDHALRDADTNLLGRGADATSRPANYRANNWEQNVRPAVGFRLEVEQYRDGKRVPVEAGRLFAQWEMEDLEEEYARWDEAMSPARPKAWLRTFIDLFKRDKGNAASKEDDNASTAFGGMRTPAVKGSPSSVLFKTPFNAGSPKPLEAPSPGKARSPVAPVTNAAGQPAGASEVIFFPMPVGGDNYRFKLALTDDGGKALPLHGGAKDATVQITTGTFTVWRKATIDLVVSFSNVDTNYINWDKVKHAYRAAFVEVDGPKETKKYDEATWKTVVKNYFINTVGVAPAVANDDTKYNFGSFFLPNLPGANADWCWTHGEALSKVFLARAYKDTGRKSPRTDTKQATRPGLFVFLCKHLHATSTALGMYLGEREFFMVTRGDGTVTFTHEMGHALYLRHSLIRFDGTNLVTTDISNDNWLDHDQKDAVVCIMAYENDFFGPDGATVRAANPVSWHFCGVCALSLRYYDLVRMSADAGFRNLIYKEFEPIKLTNDTFAALPGNKAAMAKNATLTFKALGAAEATVNNSGGPFRKDLTSMRLGRWVSGDPAVADFVTFNRLIGGRTVTFKGRLRGKNAGTAKINVHFEIDGHASETVEVDVTA